METGVRPLRDWTALAAMAALEVGLATAAQAQPTQSWGAPSREFARYGVRTMVCDTRTHDAPCLGLACRAGTLVLVSAAGGGGPMDGPTRLSTGPSSFTLRFRFDERAIDQLGVAAASAELAPDQLEALMAATSITLTAQSDARIRHQFPTRGLAEAGRWAAAGCG